MVTAPALAIEKVNTPQVVKGRTQLEYFGAATTDDVTAAQDGAQRHRFQMQRAFTDRLDVALSFTGTAHPNESNRASNFGLRAKYEFTEQGEWWLSSGVQGRYSHRVDTHADDIHIRGLVQRQQGPVTATFNLGLRRELGADRLHGLEARAAAQAIYTVSPYLSPGVEWFSVFGTLDDIRPFTDQQQEAGPILTGAVPLSDTDFISYIGGVYWGLTDEAPDFGGRLQINYVTHF